MPRPAGHVQVAQALAEDFRALLLDSLPRIEEALGDSRATASFTVTAQFATNRNEELEVVLKPRERIPLESRTHKLAMMKGQLSLFASAETEAGGA